MIVKIYMMGCTIDPVLTLEGVKSITKRGDKIDVRFKERGKDFTKLVKMLNNNKSKYEPSYEGDQVLMSANEYTYIIKTS